MHFKIKEDLRKTIGNYVIIKLGSSTPTAYHQTLEEAMAEVDRLNANGLYGTYFVCRVDAVFTHKPVWITEAYHLMPSPNLDEE